MGNKARLSKKKVLDMLHETKGAVYVAAARLKCSHTTVYKYINDHPEVKEIKEYYDGELVDYGEIALRTSVLNKEPWAVKYLLSTKGKDRGYTERQEITGANGGSIPIQFVRENRPE